MRCKSWREIRNLRCCDPTIARSTPMRRRTLTIFPLLIAIAFALFQYFGAEKVTIPDTGRTVRVGMSSEQEQALGLQSYREVLAQSEVVTSGRERELVAEVARRLARAVGDAGQGFDWQVSLIRSDQIGRT